MGFPIVYGKEKIKLVIILGNIAVGKMTVGQDLMKITDLRLFHNHMTNELVIDVFKCFDLDIIIKTMNAHYRRIYQNRFVWYDTYSLFFV